MWFIESITTGSLCALLAAVICMAVGDWWPVALLACQLCTIYLLKRDLPQERDHRGDGGGDRE